MNIVTNTVIATALAGSFLAVSAQAASDAQREECREQISGVYLGADDMKYVGERRYRDGTRMKYAVRDEDPATGYSTTRLAVCWVGNNDYPGFAGNEVEQEAMVADIDVSAPQPLDMP